MRQPGGRSGGSSGGSAGRCPAHPSAPPRGAGLGQWLAPRESRGRQLGTSARRGRAVRVDGPPPAGAASALDSAPQTPSPGQPSAMAVPTPNPRSPKGLLAPSQESNPASHSLETTLIRAPACSGCRSRPPNPPPRPTLSFYPNAPGHSRSCSPNDLPKVSLNSTSPLSLPAP